MKKSIGPVAPNPADNQQSITKSQEIIQNSGLPTKLFVEIGKRAQEVLHDKKKFPGFEKFLVEKKLKTTPDKKIDMELLSSLVVLGHVAKTMPDNTVQGI